MSFTETELDLGYASAHLQQGRQRVIPCASFPERLGHGEAEGEEGCG